MKTKNTRWPTFTQPVSLSVVIPCFNEERTVQTCIERVLNIKDESLDLEIIFVDDCSTDDSVRIAEKMAQKHPELTVLPHNQNLGKGAALKTGIQQATGQIVAIQDADLEYNPLDLKRLMVPIVENEADVVFGSRFTSGESHRVLYFWHSLGNKLLTLFSNMFSDLNLTDMECCYKVFRREVIQAIRIDEQGFGVEPELVAKVAQQRIRIFEMGVSYAGRTYEEGKKIGFRDGLRALYCVFHYNAPKLPAPIQIMIYLMIGGISALANIFSFILLIHFDVNLTPAILVAFFLAAAINYFLCISVLFRHRARWNTFGEVLAYFTVILLAAGLDYVTTSALLHLEWTALMAKTISALIGFGLNFIGRKYFVFWEPSAGSWKPQIK
jgi:dolichol-phosphate mannosyltransferase